MPSSDLKNIHKGCPECGCDRKEILLYNCGPVIYLKCPACGFVLREGTDTEIGIGALYSTWNALPRGKEKG